MASTEVGGLYNSSDNFFLNCLGDHVLTCCPELGCLFNIAGAFQYTPLSTSSLLVNRPLIANADLYVSKV